MAMQVEPSWVGVDVSKDTLAVCEQADAGCRQVTNAPGAIRAWLRELPAGSAIAAEATSHYHEALVDRAHRMGHRVYLIDGLRLNRYRDSIGGRAKTDASDAALLRRYLSREHADLRPWSPPPKPYRRLMLLLRRRERLMCHRSGVLQSLAHVSGMQRQARALRARFDQVLAQIDRQLIDLIRQAGWQRLCRRCQQVEGIGTLNAIALVTAFHRGNFASSDAFVAFAGLDVRVRDSGRFSGRRKLSKKGHGELRRLLYMAAMTARRSDTWKGYYQRMINRGMASTQALNALARKLMRVVFALLKNGTEYQPRTSALA